MNEGFAFLEGQRVSKVIANAHSWTFQFSGGAKLMIECPWRIVTSTGIAIGDIDHAQQFGLPEPVNGVTRAESLLSSSDISSASVDDETGDLTIQFSDATRLELFNYSAGYESWTLSCSDGSQFIAVGGGKISRESN